jgi:hypothetical protein
MMMRRLVAALMLTGIAAGGMWACGSDSTGPNSIAGTYNLVSVDGDSLPITAYFSDGPAGTIDVAELVSGYMRLNANGTYLRSHTYRTTRYTIDGHAIDEVTTDVATDSGSWTLSGSAITFAHGVTGQTFNGSVSENTLTIGNSVFRK